MTGPLPLLKLVLHRVQSSTSSFNFQYVLCSLRSSSSCLRLLLRLPVISILKIPLLIFNLEARRGWVVNATLATLLPEKSTGTLLYKGVDGPQS
jgi:hypothetical protein